MADPDNDTGVAGASPGQDVGGVGGQTATGGGGLGTGERRSNAAGTGLDGGAATGEGLNDIGLASGGMGTDEPQTAPQQDATTPPAGPGASGERG